MDSREGSNVRAWVGLTAADEGVEMSKRVSTRDNENLDPTL